MSHWGEVKNGVVVLREGHGLPEGAIVRVEPLPASHTQPRPGSKDAISECNTRWAGDFAELDRLLREVQQARDSDLTPQHSE